MKNRGLVISVLLVTTLTVVFAKGQHTFIDTYTPERHFLYQPYPPQQPSEELSQETLSSEEMIRGLLNEAGSCYYMADYRTAYELLIKALSLCEKYGNTTYEAQIYANMGNIYSRFKRLDIVKRYYTKALGLYRDSISILATLNNLGSVELESGQPDSAFYYLSSALKISRRHGDRYLHSIQNNIASYYQNKNRRDSALHYFHLSLEGARRDREVEKEAEVLTNLSELMLDEGRTDSAFIYSNLSNGIAVKHNFPGVAARNYLTLARIAEAQGEDRRALAYFKRHSSLTDSLFDVEKFGEISQLQRVYDVSKTDAEIARLVFEQQVKERTIFYQQVVQWGILAALAVVLAILFHVFCQKRELNKAYQALVEKNLQIIDLQRETPQAGEEKYRKSALSHDRHGELLEHILAIMEDTPVICDTKFTIDKLAELVQSNQTYVSQVINETFKKNFRSFLNTYRIREAQRILSDPDTAKYTLEAISMQVGFSSRSTFRDAFKETTGVSPSFYLKFLQDKQE